MIFNLTQPVLDSAPKFTYTGTYEYIDDGGGNWRIKFLTSGVFTPLKNMVIDAFLVGGGGGSKGGSSSLSTTAGAGGGYTATHKSINLTARTPYNIVVGAGGVGNNAGGQTLAFGNSVDGGSPGDTKNDGIAYGGNGGSGGGRAPRRGSAYAGGSDGSNGGGSNGSNGKGQGTTTREFGDPDGDLYAGGGGGHNNDGNAAGGNGGGADGGQSAQDNTGGGAGGSLKNTTTSGGSGIVVIRKHKEAAA